jgi:integrase
MKISNFCYSVALLGSAIFRVSSVMLRLCSWLHRIPPAISGSPSITIHGLRHTHATMLLNGGHSVIVVAERLGDTRRPSA